MRHNSGIENEDDHTRTTDENPESPQDIQTGNTAIHGYNL